MTTIVEAFDLPTREEITALGFVVRLEAASDTESQRRLVEDYVLTPKVREELPILLDGLRHAWQRREEIGRFIHGSFGSGKSHFLSFLGLLLEDSDVAWHKRDPLVQSLGTTHRAWIREARWLVVRAHMLTAAGRDTGLDRTLYEATNQVLRRRGKEPFEFLHVESILDEARRAAERYGDTFWQHLAREGVVGSREEFEEVAAGGVEEREQLARSYIEFTGRDPAQAAVDANWADGLQRLTAHVKKQGFDGVVFLVDELLLWLSEKSGPEFKRAINQLDVMVDHADGRRALPVGVFIARQRALSEFFPDLVQEDQLHQHLDHHAKRFEQTTLQDVELRHICKERVLKRRRPEEVERVIADLAEQHRRILPALLHGADVEYLRDVYPFHPALIEMLIDVSSLMQRERTALRLLYELLVIHYPGLPLGKFLPVGYAFEAIFPESGVEGSKRVDDLRTIHRLYYQRFRVAMERMVSAGAAGFGEARRHALDLVVKTALLAEVSPRLKGVGGMTVERLVQLNDAEVIGETDKGRISKVYEDLVELSRQVTELQVTGSGRTAVVGVVLQGANFGELMARAKTKLDPNKPFKPFYRIFLALLDPDDKRGMASWEPKEGTVDVKWKGTRRRGWLGIRNVRDLPNAAFRPQAGEEFRILVDYPWDDPGFSVEQDRQRARDVKRREGAMATVCWLPRHFDPSEMGTLLDFAAAEYIAGKDGEELLANLSPHDRQRVVERALSHADTMKGKLVGILREVYVSQGEIEPLVSEFDRRVPAGEIAQTIESVAGRILDHRYPQHPRFGSDPSAADLNRLHAWLAEASEAPGENLAFDDSMTKVLRNLGEPLELVNLGQVRGTLRRDSRFLKTIVDKASTESVRWDAIDQHLQQEPFGFQPEVRNFFLALVARLHGFRLVQEPSGEALEAKIDGRQRSGIKLVRAPLLDAPAWSRARELGPALLEEKQPAPHRTLAEQDKYAELLRKAGKERREVLQGFHAQLVRLGLESAAPRLAAIREVQSRLAPLVAAGDSFRTLTDLLAQWRDDSADPLRALARGAPAELRALENLDETTRSLLVKGRDNPVHGTRVREHLETLARSLADAATTLTIERIKAWNRAGQEIAHELVTVAAPAPAPEPPRHEPAPTPPGIRTVSVYRDRRVQVRDDAFWRELRSTISELGDEVSIDVVVRVKVEE